MAIVVHFGRALTVGRAGILLKKYRNVVGAKKDTKKAKKIQLIGRLKIQAGVIKWFDAGNKHPAGQINWEELIEFLKEHPPTK